MKDTNQLTLLEEVKAAGEDFEWYPTTRAMLEVIAANLREEFEESYHGDHEHTFSILDIGAGNGSALNILCELTKNTGQKYAIEKSRKLIEALPSDVFIVGTDFHQQTFIDKCVDVVFCNPPYSEYEAWMRRIVSESNCKIVYMVVPRRWKDDGQLMQVIERRCELTSDDYSRELEPEYRREYMRSRGVCKVIGSDTFIDSEYRQARAEVDIVKIKFNTTGRDELKVDPFDLWFESVFSIEADKKDHSSEYEKGKTAAEELHELVIGKNIIERLDELYRADLARLLDAYKSLEKIGPDLFRELGVNLKQVKGGLQQKIAGLKNLYWNELFSNMDAITNRLTSTSREAMLKKLTAHTSIDFTSDNAYALIIWAIKGANSYFDKQLLEVYLELAETDNIRNYKSNKVVLTDKWRYAAREHSHYTLDYRLVLNRWQCFGSEYQTYDFPNGLSRKVHDLLNDLSTVAKNLGFDVATNSMNLQWDPGQKSEFFLSDGTLFMDVRAYLKGTIHVRMNQDFMRKLNVEAGRLNGWVKSPFEAAEETGIANAVELFGSNYKMKSIRLLSA